MENSVARAYAEVDKILSYMDKKNVDKIPLKLRSMIKEEKENGYEPNINPNISLATQNLQRKTLAMLAMFNLNYWCENEEEKQKLLQQYAKNGKLKEAEIREKYNPNEIFKNKQETNQATKKLEIVEYKKKNFIQEIIQKIQNLFKTRKS